MEKVTLSSRLAGLIVLFLIQLTVVGAITTIIDDSDSRISYTGDWTVVADHILKGANTNYYGGATHTTTTVGASASLTFTGTGITYYGDVDVDNAAFTVVLDSVSTPRTAKSTAFASNQVLYTISGLADTVHTFSITHTGAKGEWATLDRLVIESNAPTSTVALTSYVTMTTEVTLGGHVYATTLVSPVGANDAQATYPTTTNSAETLSTGAIVGIAVGSVALLALLAGIAFLLLRKRNNNPPASPNPAPLTSPTIPSFYPTAYKGYPEPHGVGANGLMSWHSSSVNSGVPSAASYQQNGLPVVPGYSPPAGYNPYSDMENRSSGYNSNNSPPMQQDRTLSMGSYDQGLLYDQARRA